MDYNKHLNRTDKITESIKDILDIDTGFAASCEIPAGANELLMATDGVGTKIKLAYQYNDYSGIGQDLVAMCANDIIAAGGEPKYFNDYIGTNRIRSLEIKLIIKSINRACVKNGIKLVGGETAELKDTYVNEYPELVGCCTGFKINPTELPKRGDQLIGLPSSGFHSNGFTVINDLLGLTAYIPELLTPTTIYSNVTKFYKQYPGMIKAVANITGGGIHGNVKRIIPGENFTIDYNYIVKRLPTVFKIIKTLGRFGYTDMFNAFNMGVGMVLVLSPGNVDFVTHHLEGDVFWLGEVA